MKKIKEIVEASKKIGVSKAKKDVIAKVAYDFNITTEKASKMVSLFTQKKING